MIRSKLPSPFPSWLSSQQHSSLISSEAICRMSLQIPGFSHLRSRSRSRSNSDVSTNSHSSSSSATKIDLELPQCSADRYREAVEKELGQLIPVEGNDAQQAMLELIKERHYQTIQLAKERLKHIRDLFNEVVESCRGTDKEKASVRQRQFRFLMIASDDKDPLLNYLYDGNHEILVDVVLEMLSYARGQDRRRGSRSASSVVKKFSDESLRDRLSFLRVSSSIL